jgi:spore maturation protein CgeB
LHHNKNLEKGVNALKKDAKMKIVPVFLRYDYGKRSRGESLEFVGFYPALKQIFEEVFPFWFDEYLDEKDKLQKKLIEFVDEINPDIVFFILMKDEFSFETLDYLKSKFITINWFCDDHWRFESFTKSNAPHFTFSVTTDKFALSKYRNIEYKNVILSQWASFGYSENLDFESIEYKYDVSFVGSISGYRKWVIKELLKKGIKVECFGNGWKNGRVSFEKMKEIFKTSRINLNISNSSSYDIRYAFSSLRNISDLNEFVRQKKRAEQIKARNFEIPTYGGFQLTNYVLSLEDYFEIGNEVAIYTSIDDLVLQINYYLENEEKRKENMINGYRSTIKKDTYLNRLKGIFEEIDENL